MQVGMHSQGIWQNHVFTGPSSRGERLVARNDQDNDGKLSPAELQGTKLGRRMSVDRFASLDRNDDGMLEASELSRRTGRGSDSPSMMEQVVVARFANYLAAKPETEVKPDASKVADAVLARLDKDGSTGLNSEEIAGSRLAEKLGSGFYELDRDKNGALDKEELTAFISKAFLEQTETNDEADATKAKVADDDADSAVKASTSDAANTTVAPAQADVDEPVATASKSNPGDTFEFADAQPLAATAAASSSSVAFADQVRASFEAALEVLKSGADQRSAYDVVRTLYAEVNGIIGET
jgi:Ca2+-binding EF-hand superfamily protein